MKRSLSNALYFIGGSFMMLFSNLADEYENNIFAFIAYSLAFFNSLYA